MLTDAYQWGTEKFVKRYDGSVVSWTVWRTSRTAALVNVNICVLIRVENE